MIYPVGTKLRFKETIGVTNMTITYYGEITRIYPAGGTNMYEVTWDDDEVMSYPKDIFDKINSFTILSTPQTFDEDLFEV